MLYNLTRMHRLSLLILFGCFLGGSSFAGTETLITYYPAPNGNYSKITSNAVRLTPSTLSHIQKLYKCSFDPVDHLSACPAGLTYYDTDAHTLAVSDGTHWRVVNSMCVPVKPCSQHPTCGSDDCGTICGPGSC